MAPRPGRIAAEVRTDMPVPRDPGFRTSPEYAAACRTVSARLIEAMAA